MIEKKSLGRRLAVGIIIALSSTLICLVALEVGFRRWVNRSSNESPLPKPILAIEMGLKATRPADSPDLIYEYRPDVSYPGQPHFTNSLGMRGPETTVEKPAGTIRIAGLGDSIMAGDRWPADQTFLFILQDLLNDDASSTTRYEALNFSVLGYNTAQEAVALREKALAFQPDLVLLAVTCNDWERPIFYRIADGKGGVQLVTRYTADNREPFSTGIAPDERPWWAASVFARWLHHRWFLKRDYPRGMARFCEAFVEIAETCKTHDVPLLAVIMTEDVAVDQDENPREPWHALVREVAGDLNVPCLDMYPAIRARLERDGTASYSTYWTNERDLHPTPEGHRLIAELIYDWMKETPFGATADGRTTSTAPVP